MNMNSLLRLFLFIISLIVFEPVTAQSSFTLSGYVRDSLSRESLIGATITVQGQVKGVKSNAYGYFSLSLPAGQQTILATFIGYQPRAITVDVRENVVLNISLEPVSTLSQEIIVSGKRRDANVRDAQMGQIDLSMNRIRSLPVIFGEVDPLKALQLMPGVANAGEGNSGIYVRGGGPDQNLIMLDDAIVYNSGHLFGFFSIFNGDAIKNVSLIKGGMPAQYGGRLSSVLDVSMKDGNMRTFQAARHVCMTYAPPGTVGYHHVNCREESYWIEVFTHHGFEHDAELTQQLRAASSMRRDFVRHTGLYFRNRSLA